MTRKNEDETDDALRRLAEAQEDSAHGDAAPSESSIPMEAPQNQTQPQRARPAAPGAPAESKQSPARPSRPSRPAAPPTPIEQSPAIEAPPPPPEEPAFVADDDDDDVVIAPAPEPAVFAARKPTAALQASSLHFRRTLIPILLTFGVALPAIGIWWFTLDSESPIKVLGLVFPITLMALGIVLLFLAALNMTQVRRILQQVR
jgi:hypothetical protein